jgi:short-subunit dehydrogenase
MKSTSAHRFALITGASGGLGAAFAKALPTTTSLLLTGRNCNVLELLAAELACEGRIVETLVADLTNSAERDAVIARAEALQIDLLINNAGAGHLGAILDQSTAVDSEVINLNVLAMVALVHGLLPGMLTRARANHSTSSLIVVASTVSFVPVPYLATYGASKAFVLHFTEALTEELRGEPINILTLCPGPTRTPANSSSTIPLTQLPGAPEPRTVARLALEALGCRTLLVTGPVGGTILKPLLRPRNILTANFGRVMRIVKCCFDPRKEGFFTRKDATKPSNDRKAEATVKNSSKLLI